MAAGTAQSGSKPDLVGEPCRSYCCAMLSACVQDDAELVSSIQAVSRPPGLEYVSSQRMLDGNRFQPALTVLAVSCCALPAQSDLRTPESTSCWVHACYRSALVEEARGCRVQPGAKPAAIECLNSWNYLNCDFYSAHITTKANTTHYK